MTATTAGIRVSDVDLHLLAEGRHYDLPRRLGGHLAQHEGRDGGVFSVWAPNARGVAVAGDWDGWAEAVALRPLGSSGVWEAFVPGAAENHRYKLRVETASGEVLEKADPLARWAELPAGNASILSVSRHPWEDGDWLASRPERQAPGVPLSLYEVHLGSWRRAPGETGGVLGYRELAPLLADHCERLGYTHVQLMPVMEHPYTASWGYQVTGFFAATSRYGHPDDLKFMIDHLHGRGIGVILDWVPAHFPDDPHGLVRFDGTALYEHDDPREGRHPDWGSLIFNYGRNEVLSFLVSSACWWLDEYHADGLRVDAVASMLYRDYSRPAGEWVPNRFGGRENLEAVAFLRACSDEVRRRHPDALFIAEESTSWPGVTGSTATGGLGFTHKWDMGWMHDTLRYLGRDVAERSSHHTDLTFRGLYLDAERWILPLSHDEVVHGKRTLLGRMPGDRWQQLANLRVLFAHQFGSLGGKLLFMGGELGQLREWDHDASIDWDLLNDPGHAGIATWIGVLNRLYLSRPSLRDDPGSFRWISCDDVEQSVVAWERCANEDSTAWIFNLTPVPRQGYRVGFPAVGSWGLLLCSDASDYGGSGHPVAATLEATAEPLHGRPASAVVTLPPVSAVVYGRVST